MQEEGSEPGDGQPPDEQPGTGELEVLVPESGTEEIVFDDSELAELPPGTSSPGDGVEVIDLRDSTGDSEEERKSWHKLDDAVAMAAMNAAERDESADYGELALKAKEMFEGMIERGEVVMLDNDGTHYFSGNLIEKVTGEITRKSSPEETSYSFGSAVHKAAEKAMDLDKDACPFYVLEERARKLFGLIRDSNKSVREKDGHYLFTDEVIERVADELTKKPAEEPKKRKGRLYKNVRVAAAVLVGVAIGATIYEVARNGNSEAEKAHYIDEKVDEDSHFEIVDGGLEIPASIDRISVIQGEVDERDYWLMHSRVLETVKLGKDAEPGKVLRAKQKLYEDAFEAAREKVADGFKVRFKEKEDERGRTSLEATVDLYRIR